MKRTGLGRRGHPLMLFFTTSMVFVVDQASKVVARTFDLGASAQNDTLSLNLQLKTLFRDTLPVPAKEL